MRLPYVEKASQAEYKPIITSILIGFLFFLLCFFLSRFFYFKLFLHQWFIMALMIIAIVSIKIIYCDLPLLQYYSQFNHATRTALHQINKRFTSMQTLLRIKKNYRGTSLKELPCVVLIGARGSGKTSLLLQSELSFILHKKILNRPEETQAPQWFVSDHYCFIDVPGKYFASKLFSAQESKHITYDALWQNIWLNMKNKKPQGLSTVMICVPLAENILTVPPRKQMVFWRFLSRRLQDISKHFPNAACYLILTKCDYLKGFSTFFSDLSIEESQQPYGLHLSPNLPIRQQIETINQLYMDLLQRIKHQMMLRLHRENNPFEKINMLQFPSALEQLKERLLVGLDYLASRSLNISLSGIYFTSAYRHAANDLSSDMSGAQTNLPSLIIHPELSRPYFIHQLLQKTKLSKVTNEQWMQYLPYVSYAAASGMVCMTGLMMLDFFNGHRLLQQLTVINAHYQQQLSLPFDAKKNLHADVEYFNGLKKISNHFFPKWHYFSYAAEKTIEKNRAWFIDQQLLLSWQHYLADALLHANKNSPQLYEQLQSYLMLGGALSKNPAAIKKLFLSHASEWDEAGLSGDYFRVWMQRLTQNTTLQLPLRPEIVAHARHLLWSRSVAELGMLVLENQMHDGNGLSLLNATQPLIFYTKQPTEIKSLFTANQLQKIFSGQLNEALQVAIHGNAVLGLPLFPRMADEKAELSALQQLYLKQYITTWENALFNLRLSEPKDLREADDMITVLISDRSPLLSLLHLVHDNTYFSPMTDISNTLQMLGGLWLGQNNSPLLLRIFSKLKAVHEYLQPILLADNPKKAAYVALADRKPDDKPDVLTALYLVAEDCPEPLKQWLRRLANQTWKQLLLLSNAHMNTALNDGNNKKNVI